MIKKAFGNHYVINVNNPVNFSELGEIDESTNAFELSNKFNTYAVATKCIAIGNTAFKFMFSREEIISQEDTRNKNFILKRVMLSLSIVIDAPSVFLSVAGDNEAEKN
ncbi:hypothetical protein [Serratia fonticola]|nr:hypothetical protein [Serratia fonticola]